MFVVDLRESIARVDMPGPWEESGRRESGDQAARRVKGKKGKGAGSAQMAGLSKEGQLGEGLPSPWAGEV